MQLFLKLRPFLLGLLILLGILSGTQLGKVRLSYDFESFFPQGSTDIAFFEQHKEAFKTDSDFLLLGWDLQEAEIDSFCVFLPQLEKALEQLPYIEAANTPLDLKRVKMGPFGPIPVPIIPQLNRTALEGNHALLTEIGFKDATAHRYCIGLQLESGLSKVKSDSCLAAIEQEMQQFSGKYFVAGRIHGQKVVIDQMAFNLKLFTLLGALLVGFILWFIFKSGWGIAAPLVLLFSVMLFLGGVLGYFDIPVTILGTVLPTILFVVSVSDAIHLTERYIFYLAMGHSRKGALQQSIREIGLATFLTSLTTAFGFLALLLIPIQPIQQFGLQVSLGVLLAFILTFSLYLIILSYLPKKEFKRKEFRFRTGFNRLFAFILNKRKAIWVSTALFVLIALWGVSRISINNRLLEDWDTSSESFTNYAFFEEHFGGIRPFEMNVGLAENSNILDPEVWDEMERLEQYLETQYELGSFLGLTQLLKAYDDSLDFQSDLTLPEWTAVLQGMKKYRKKIVRQLIQRGFLNADQNQFRIWGRGQDLGGKHYFRKNSEFDTYLSTEPFQKIRPTITGIAHLVDLNNLNISRGLIQGLLIAITLVFLVLLLLFRDWRPVVAAILPNLLPLIGVLGFMGIVGIELKVSTAIVLTIVFGIAVDDTIHFMNGLLIQQKKCRHPLLVIKETLNKTGKSILTTSIILMGGFILLVFSGFKSTYYLGCLVSLGLFLAVVADLVLLPLCLVVFQTKKAQ